MGIHRLEIASHISIHYRKGRWVTGDDKKYADLLHKSLYASMKRTRSVAFKWSDHQQKAVSEWTEILSGTPAVTRSSSHGTAQGTQCSHVAYLFKEVFSTCMKFKCTRYMYQVLLTTPMCAQTFHTRRFCYLAIKSISLQGTTRHCFRNIVTDRLVRYGCVCTMIFTPADGATIIPLLRPPLEARCPHMSRCIDNRRACTSHVSPV